MTTLNSKKRGRPVGSKNKIKRGRPAKVKTFKQFDPTQRAFAKIIELEKIRENLHNMIDNLEHQAVQYKAVISYLENKLENR
jgi:hypothetical protein